MTDWRSYFMTRLTGSGHYVFENEVPRGSIRVITFKSTRVNDFTTIEVGILANDDLITFEIHNPRTLGFSAQQRLEYFYKYTFHPTAGYGGVGLEYIPINIDHFDKLLKEGQKGKEIQYFREGQLIKSEVFQSMDDNDTYEFGTTIEFVKKGFWNQLADRLQSIKEPYDNKLEIDLNEIFPGLE
jgi:hypothetical protein